MGEDFSWRETAGSLLVELWHPLCSQQLLWTKASLGPRGKPGQMPAWGLCEDRTQAWNTGLLGSAA